MKTLRSIWRTIAHDHRFLIAVLGLIEAYYILSLMSLSNVGVVEPLTLLLKYLVPMSLGGYLLYREVKALR